MMRLAKLFRNTHTLNADLPLLIRMRGTHVFVDAVSTLLVRTAK